MNGSYEFMIDLRRLVATYRRFEQILYLLNAAIIAILVYMGALFLGIPAFFRFYWQDFLPLAEAPALISLILGLLVAGLIKRRSKLDFFQLLEGDLSEMAKTAYDNRRSDSVVMHRLAEEVKSRLSQVSRSDLIDHRRFRLRDKSAPMLYLKSAAVVLLLGTTLILNQSLVGEDISPADFQTLVDIKDRATELFQEEDQSREGDSDLGEAGEIYGEPSLAVLEEVNLELLLFPGAGAGFRSEEIEPQNRLFQAAPPGEGVAVPTELYIESLPPQHREIVKLYFETLAKG